MKMARLAILAAALLAAVPARADRIILTLSSPEVTIASNFQGAEMTFFGAVAEDTGVIRPLGKDDIVVTAKGPEGPLVVREKERTAGLWLNRSGGAFKRAPSFLAVLSNRPLAEIAPKETLAADDLGLDAVAASRAARREDVALFAPALKRLQVASGLWREEPNGVSSIGWGLFKGTIRLPPNVPLGAFEVEARLISGGRTLAREVVPFQVVKSGFEARVAELSDRFRLAYGLTAVALALLFGWLASVIFRRD